MVGLVAGVLAAGSVVSAAPAFAQGPGDPVACVPSDQGPSQSIVWVNGLDVGIDPNGQVYIPERWSLDPVFAYYQCVRGDVVVPIPPLPCTLPENLDYVTVDPETGAVQVHGNELAAYLTGCLS